MNNDENIKVVGSNPAARTIFPQIIEGIGVSDTVATENPAGFVEGNMRFPKRIKPHGRVFATIYTKRNGRDALQRRCRSVIF
jgi:hypothetical protein